MLGWLPASWPRRPASHRFGVREHDALCAARRPAGVDERGQVVVGARHDRTNLGALQLLDGDDPDRSALAGTLDRVAKRGRRDRGDRLRVEHDPAQLLGGEEEDHRRRDGSRAPDPVVGDADVGRVLHHHHHPVAGTDPGRREACGRARRAVEELARAVPRALEEERVVVAAALVRRLGEPREVAAHSVRIDWPPAFCIEAIIPAGAAPSGYRATSSSSRSSGSQPSSRRNSSPASHGLSALTAPP